MVNHDGQSQYHQHILTKCRGNNITMYQHAKLGTINAHMHCTYVI